jgi:hypothetical protein
MDEITMYTALRPQAPGNAGELTGAVRQRVAGEFGPTARRTRRLPGRRRLLLAAGAIATAAAAAIAIVQTAGSERSTNQFVTAAWVVKHNPNGTVKVTLKQARDAAGLQRALRADGIPAYVRIGPWWWNPAKPLTAWPAEQCSQAGGGPPVARKVLEEVFPFPAGGGPDQGYALTIRPSAIPEGDSILIDVTWSPDRPIFGMDVGDLVMSTTKPPACRPTF